MQIQVNTDNNIEGRETLASEVRATIDQALQRFAPQITRVEVHLGDENGAKVGQDDKRCLIEARLAGRQPVTATAHAATLDEALRGASTKLVRVIESQLGRLASADRSPPIPAEED